MNNKTKRKSPEPERGPCLCEKVGPAVSEFLKRIGPPPEARRHFGAARTEFLKGIRAIIDARIAHLGKPQPKGETIPVE